jgi:hypothetical protein
MVKQGGTVSANKTVYCSFFYLSWKELGDDIDNIEESTLCDATLS